MPYLTSLVKAAVAPDFKESFADLKNGPFCAALPFKSGKLLSIETVLGAKAGHNLLLCVIWRLFQIKD